MAKTDPMQEVRDAIDAVTDPKRMSKTEYRDFLEDLEGEVQMRLEAVNDELKDEVRE